MKKTLYIAIAAMFGAVALTGCQKQNSSTDSPARPEGDEMSLQINGLSWDSSQSEIGAYLNAGVFAVPVTGTLTDERYVDNAEFVKKGDKFYGRVPVMYPDASCKVIAYIPYGILNLPTGKTTAEVSVKTDQSNVTDYVASDFMTSYDFVKKGTAGPASLTMKRMFSKINLEFTSTNISAEDLVNSFAEMTLNTTAVADLSAEIVSSASNRGNIIPKGRLSDKDGVCSGLTFITVPQQISAEDKCLHLTVNGQTSDYALGEDKTLESGMEYTFSLVVNKIGNKYALEVIISEKPWKSGLDVNFDVNQEIDEIKPVTDIDGNVYQVVKVGAQYWTTSNLHVTRYNDGTSIDFISAKDKWGQVAETKQGAYCVYNDDLNNEDDYGFLYNWHAVNTDKLCPEGWKVPTLSEFMMFVNELGGEGLAGNLMKSTSGWVGYRKDELPDYQGTNGSGFDARPGGYRNDAGAFFNVSKYGYWWCSSTQNGASGDAIYVYFNSPGVFKTSALFRTGYSVRCIKY